MTNRVTIIGAGAVGCYLAGAWAVAGAEVTLVGRSTVATLQDRGIALDGGARVEVNLTITDDAGALAHADVVVVTVKSVDLHGIIAPLRAVPDYVPILSLLNGLSPVAKLRDALPNKTILAGTVPFNVVRNEMGGFCRSSAGQVVAQDHAILRALAQNIGLSVAPLGLRADIEPWLAGKLLLNLNNPINALSGVGLKAQLSNRGYREIYARVLEEALAVFAHAGIAHEKVGPVPAAHIPRILRLPSWIFRPVALRLQRIDGRSKTSMAVDLAEGRRTEVDTINGDIVAIAARSGTQAPLNEALRVLVHRAEDGGQNRYAARELAEALGVSLPKR